MYPLNNSLLLFLLHCDADTVALLVPLEPAPAPSNWAVKLECRGRALTRLGMYILIRSLSAAWRGGDVRAAVTFRRTQQREPTGSVSTQKKNLPGCVRNHPLISSSMYREFNVANI